MCTGRSHNSNRTTEDIFVFVKVPKREIERSRSDPDSPRCFGQDARNIVMQNLIKGLRDKPEEGIEPPSSKEPAGFPMASSSSGYRLGARPTCASPAYARF